MPRLKRTKESFKRDEKGRAILDSAKEMAEWVKLGFKEQEARRCSDIPFERNYIDLSNCVLYVSYPIVSKDATSKIFNLCHVAGIVPGIEKIEDDPNYLFEVTLDIHFDGSELYGNFFHYVKFNGTVSMDDVTVRSTFSCFRCLFQNYVYVQRIHITGHCDFEQCEFQKGLLLAGASADLFHFNYCTIKDYLSLSSACLVNHNHTVYPQSIELTNCSVKNLTLSKINTNGLPIFLVKSSISGLHADNVSLACSLCFNSCLLDGVMTAVTDEVDKRNQIKALIFHSCNLDAQYHIENTDLEKFEFNFSSIGDKGRLRLYQCGVKELTTGCSSVYGQMDVIKNTISYICLEGTCVQGYLNFQENAVEKYANRQVLRLLKNEVLKVNDYVEATKLFAKEMDILLADKDIPWYDKMSLRFNKCFSRFGVNWWRPLLVTLLLCIVLTLLMLGFGSAKYGINLAGKFMGPESFVTVLLENMNLFSIPLFSDSIKEYELNVLGQVLYYLIKIVVAYGSYQFVVAFRKYDRK